MGYPDEIQVLSSNFFVWSQYSSKIKSEVFSSAYLSSEGKLVLIDPTLLSAEILEIFFSQTALPSAIFLTSENHLRDALTYQEKYDSPIYASEKTIEHLGLPLKNLKKSYGILPITIPGASYGETAFLTQEGVLVLGDSVIHLSSEGIELLPKKYTIDYQQNIASLLTLLDYEFHTIVFAHGTPLTTNAKQRLQGLLG